MLTHVLLFTEQQHQTQMLEGSGKGGKYCLFALRQDATAA
jgi:hypothetical protein